MNHRLYQKLVIKLRGRKFLKYEIRDGWLKQLPIYLTKCSRHGYYEDYQHGEYDMLDCPGCIREKIVKHECLVCVFAKSCEDRNKCRLRFWTYVSKEEADEYNLEAK